MSKTLSVIIGTSTILLTTILDKTFRFELGFAGRVAIACVLDVIVIAIIGLCKEG